MTALGVADVEAQKVQDQAGATGATEPSAASRTSDGRLHFVVDATVGEIHIDGVLDDAGWASATSIPIAWEVDPAENGPAPVATDCQLTFDEEHLFLGCRASDPDPSSIRAYVTDRDRIDGHDRIVLTLDPFNDQRRAFQFGVSPLGVQSDAVYARQATGNPQMPMATPVDPSWDAIWQSAGSLTDDGFVIEAAIPFSSLRFPASVDPEGWGLYLTRWWPRSSMVEMRSAEWDRADSCILCQANVATGIDGGSPTLNVQLTPAVTGGRTESRNGPVPSPLEAGPLRREFGVDGMWGITSDLTMNLTANPDFSQVEADVAQLDVNNRFALFFPEKRPFFMEGADFFGTPLQAVFTRSIVEPTVGGKLTGKLGSNAVGVLAAQDRSNRVLLPGSQFSRSAELAGNAVTAVGRFRRDFGNASTVGALYSGREGEGYYNRVGGADAFYQPLPSVTVRAQLLASTTRYPDAFAADHDQPSGAFTGRAAEMRASWESRGWTARANARDISEGFRADAGFMPQTGVQDGSVALTRRWWGGRDRWYNQFRLEAGTWMVRDQAGQQIHGGMWTGLTYIGPGQTVIGVWPNLFQKEHFAGSTYEGLNLLWLNASTAPTGSLSLALNGFVGDMVDYENQRLGFQKQFAPRLNAQLGRKTELGLQHTWQRLTYGGDEVFTAHLAQLRGVYNFSARSFVRAIVQYRRTNRNVAAYNDPVDERDEGLFGQFLYAYKVNPQTVFYLGWSQDGDGRIDPLGEATALSTRGRTLFVKLGYAWRP